jgi:hypothetical protein
VVVESVVSVRLETLDVEGGKEHGELFHLESCRKEMRSRVSYLIGR